MSITCCLPQWFVFSQQVRVWYNCVVALLHNSANCRMQIQWSNLLQQCQETQQQKRSITLPRTLCLVCAGACPPVEWVCLCKGGTECNAQNRALCHISHTAASAYAVAALNRIRHVAHNSRHTSRDRHTAHCTMRHTSHAAHHTSHNHTSPLRHH